MIATVVVFSSPKISSMLDAEDIIILRSELKKSKSVFGWGSDRDHAGEVYDTPPNCKISW